MKKTYIIPVTGVTVLSIERMVASSDPSTIKASVGEGEITSGYADTKGSGNYNVWNDDWSE